MDIIDRVRDYWDRDAAHYDHATSHHVAASPTERTAWRTALVAALPAAPARVLDVGAGTGFVSLLAAELGHEVVALDLSPEMLARLEDKAEQRGLAVTTHNGPAAEPPPGPFDAVVQRHLQWTLPDPPGALAAWREAAPEGRLLVFESLWGRADRAAGRRQELRRLYRRATGRAGAHHAPYDERIREAVPFGRGLHPDELIPLVEEAGWGPPTIRRLRDVEWARQLAKPPAERLLGTFPVYLLQAGGPG